MATWDASDNNATEFRILLFRLILINVNPIKMIDTGTVPVQSVEHSQYVAASTLRSSPIFRQYVRPCCAEILGTIVFVFVSCMCVVGVSEGGRQLVVAITQSVTILALYGTLAPFSGGHYNPAVSLAVWLAGGTSFPLMIFYMVCHILGGFIGALLFRTVLDRNVYLLMSPATIPLINFNLINIGQAILIEMIGSCAWSLAVLMTVVDGSRPIQTGGVFVGSAVFMGTVISHNFTNANLNPAGALGLALAYTVFADGQWEHHYVFWVGPFLGATMACFMYRLMFANDEKRILFKK